MLASNWTLNLKIKYEKYLACQVKPLNIFKLHLGIKKWTKIKNQETHRVNPQISPNRHKIISIYQIN